MAHAQGVPPDWFQDKPQIWYDWARIRYQVKVEVQKFQAEHPDT